MSFSKLIPLFKGNQSIIDLLLEGERFIVIEVNDSNGSLNNSIIKLQQLLVYEDEDGLPDIAPSGITRQYRYNRENLDTVINNLLPKLQSIPTITHNGDISPNSIVDSLLSYGLNLGYDSITVERIGRSNILILKCTDKSIRFRGDTRIAIV